MHKWIYYLLLSSIFPCWGSNILHHDQRHDKKIESVAILQEIDLFRNELNGIRAAMRKPLREHQENVSVVGASPQECFFQANVLLQYANQLAYEVANSPIEKTDLKLMAFQPKHVWQLINKSNKKLALVKETLSITTRPSKNQEMLEKDFSEVFNELIKANGELNHLLKNKLGIKAIYQEVTSSINYMSQILRFSNKEITRIPTVKKTLKKAHSRRDIYQLLVESIDVLKAISKLSSLEMLTVRSNLLSQTVTNNELYLLTTIIFSKVYYFYYEIPEPLEMIESYQPDITELEPLYERVSLLKAPVSFIT